MKTGAEPDEDADYWEERKMIEKHIADMEEAQINLEEINSKFENKSAAFDEVQTQIKEITEGDIGSQERALANLAKNKCLLEDLMNEFCDVEDVFSTTRQEMDECQIPVNIALRASEVTQFSEKLDRMIDEFHDLKKADADFEGTSESE